MAVLYTQHFVQFFDNNGDPLSNGELYAYSAGTTTPKATYTTKQATVQNAHPVALDSAGRAVVFIEGAYRFDLKDQDGNLIKSVDNVDSFATLSEEGDPFFQTFSGNGSQTAFTLSESLGSDSKDIMVYVDNGNPNYVLNGDFGSDAEWTKGAGWTIGTGVATATGAISTALSQTSDQTLVENQSYVLTYTITRSAGGIIPSIGGRDGVERTADGTYSEIINAGSTQAIEFTGNGFTGTVDDVTIKSTANIGYEIQNPSAYTLSATSLSFNTAPLSGTDNIYVFAPTKLLGAASASASAAAVSASEAQAAAASVGTLSITSTSSVAIGTGSKTFTVNTGLGLIPGQWAIILSDANPTVNYMTGQITSYSGATLIFDVSQVFGSGTFDDWTIRLSGTGGTQGLPGTIGDLSGVPTGTIDPAADFFVFQDVNDSNTTKRSLLGSAAVLNVGTAANNVVQLDGSARLPAVDGSQLTGLSNVAYAENSTQQSIAAPFIPIDNTIPQNTEGTEVLTATITPKSLTSKIRITFVGGSIANSGAGAGVAALFINDVANAIFTRYTTVQGVGEMFPHNFTCIHEPATLSPVTYKVRLGCIAGSMSFLAASALFGGTLKATLLLEEI